MGLAYGRILLGKGRVALASRVLNLRSRPEEKDSKLEASGELTHRVRSSWNNQKKMVAK